jgi:hypothetical protein
MYSRRALRAPVASFRWAGTQEDHKQVTRWRRNRPLDEASLNITEILGARSGLTSWYTSSDYTCLRYACI